MTDLEDGSGLTVPLSDGVAIVTGGSGGIGGGVVAALSGRGVRTAVLDLAASGSSGPGGAALTLDCDVRDPAAVAAAVARVSAELGPIGYLVCAAGVVSEAPVTELDPAEFRRVVEISLYGTFHALRAVLPHMVTRGRGSVVAMSTGWATKGYPNGAHYAAAKAGVEALVKSAALEVAAAGVRVNAVAPGPVETPMLTDFPDYRARAADRARAIPMGRVGEVGDVVGPVMFLLGQDSEYMTGQVVQVNGGLLMP
ncbi:2-hydroxycyclohexanecarboxyl-CoA dehydrogenase [Streptosporangium subroseum]|uniref:2-hydroxycyclohexanecarboxyl-CoA dehydrogenase n=1 Tax=Streptosporangium subroseum TaxID=106412 RepID=A0A239D078_9ACTN|nr:SDR family oxidoreductase [Streptosporangium subroseum]SNS25281.1 2-hydroxycyclohexanecarboxyl-CoA dehydrogenase [Streptosporangium subroseum]